MKSIFSLVVLMVMAFTFSCSSSCEECTDNFEFHFRFVTSDQEVTYEDLALLSLTDLAGNEIGVDQVVSDNDQVYRATLTPKEATSEAPDSIRISYNGTRLDDAGIKYSYKRDSECCINPQVVETISLEKLEVRRLIRREFDVYSIIIE